MRTRIPSHQGFTLLEVLIAIAIMALLSLSAYQVLQGLLTSNQIGASHQQKLQALQRTMTRLEQDMTQMVDRTTRTEGQYGEQPLTVGHFLFDSDAQAIELVRLGWSNPLSRLPRSGLQRVIYRLKEGQLQRGSFLYPDPAIGTEPRYQVLLDGVTDLRLRYFADQGWHHDWTGLSRLPEGIEIVLETRTYGELRRVFTLVQSFDAGTSRLEDKD